MDPITNQEIYSRLILTMVLAGLIGLEREYHHKPAGLRTNVMVGLGSTLMTIASIKGATLLTEFTGDPTRIAAQIVTGIGFIGAGVILRPSSGRGQIIGLTTAATLWVVSGLGIAVGMGFYTEAIVTTALVFFTFVVLSQVVGRLRLYTKAHPPKYEHDDDEHIANEAHEH